MKKNYFNTYFIILMIIINISPISANELFNDWGLNVGFNTFRLVGENGATKPMMYKLGGGLEYIESGIDISAVFFLDTNYKHRFIFGGEYIFMNAKEVESIRTLGYNYIHHQVQLADFYVGYHYSFYQAPFQNVRLYAGIELMANNMVLNNYQWGYKQTAHPWPPEYDLKDTTEHKFYNNAAFRFGSRIRAGFEGRLHEKIYANASFTLGIYNLLGRNDDVGELFNQTIPAILFNDKESLQPFFNFLVSFQYRFNDKLSTETTNNNW